MAVLIVHLSDIHLGVGNQSVLTRADKIVDAALSPTALIEAVHIVVSGDLANWGLQEEFDLGLELFRKLSEQVERRCGFAPQFFISAGNHDCNFQGDQSLRDVAIDRVRSNPSALTPRITEELASVLQGFYAAQKAVMPDVVQHDEWFAVSEVAEPQAIRYVLLNSAVSSKRKEEIGKLYARIPSIEDSRDGKRTIYVMHHTFNWLLPDNARELAQHASGVADLFLMGHEHVLGAQATRDLYDDTTTVYLKAHALQDVEDPANSAFQTIQVDAEAGCLLRSYIWQNGRYEPWGERSRDDYLAWPNSEDRKKLGVTHDGYKELNSAGANFTHRNKDQITLSDIFVWPRIRVVNPERENGAAATDDFEIDSELLVDTPDDYAPVVVLRGGEQSGKSALAKMLALNLARKGRHPILLAASHVSSWREKSLNERVDHAIDALYGVKNRTDYRLLPPQKKVLIIDDFDLSQVTKGYFDGLRALRQHFGQIYLMLDSHPGLEVALNEFLRDELFIDSDIFDLLPSSYHHRLELIEKWLRVGNSEQADEDLKLTAARLSKVVDETLGRNLIPAVPVFVLIILQRAELAQDLDTVVKSGSQGFLYESLIHQALSTRVKACNVVTSLTYLTEFARTLRSLGADGLAQSDFEAFHVEHCKRFALDLSVARFQAQIVSAEILEDRSGTVRFKYPFHSYYFVARALSRIADWQQLEPEIDLLVSAIHTERAANTLLFLAHIGRDARIAEKIIKKANGMFVKFAEKEANLFAKVSAFDKYSLKEIRGILLDGGRSAQLLEWKRDEVEAENSQKELTSVAEARLRERLDDALAMNAAFKTLQVLGQVLRNHAGEIEREEKVRITKTCVSLGLRLLGFLYDMVNEHGEEMIAFRGAQIRVEKPEILGIELADELARYLPSFISSISVGTLIKIANAIGSEDLAPTLDQVLSNSPTHQLLKLAVHLEHFADFPKKEILDYEEDVLRSGGYLPNAVLRRFIVRRFYLFPVRDELKRAVLERFNIKALPFKFLEQKQPSGH
ncbi:metallophosphoesterase [Lysobacter sp. A289]